ncbi:sodium:proton antiporter [soil metagenome]
MTVFQILSILMTVTAAFSYLNHRFLKLPVTIGVMLLALSASGVLMVTRHFDPSVEHSVARSLAGIEFDKALMQGMLSFLLFAGALQINLGELLERKRPILVLATVGVVLSTAIAGTGLYYVLGFLGLRMSYAYCLLFGALISPTDPIAVLSILKIVKVPRPMELTIAGESLFNDGIGVVAFTILFEIALEGVQPTGGHVAMIFLKEAIGGGLFGFGLGLFAYFLLKSVDNYQVEVMVTLALVTGGYALTSALHMSGPIAIVVAGLLIGNHGRRLAMSDQTREHLDAFWELLDEILNALLFVLIGLEVLLLKFTPAWFVAGVAAIALLLFARWISVALPIHILRRWDNFDRGAIAILTWSGLRGGISVALALSIPAGHERDLILAITYIVVIFSIIAQGLTVKKLIKRYYPDGGQSSNQ